MEEIHRELHEAALAGDATSLLKLLQVDALAIERCAAGCYVETPLHMAAMLGHFKFAEVILDQKPELARVLDIRRWSPLHLASANGHLQLVKALLLVDTDMCLTQDWDGWSPLHVAVIRGRVEILKELVLAKPEAVLLRGERGETLLHLCVKHCQLDALKLLVEVVNDTDNGFVNSKNDDGLTVLHLAVAKREVEIVNFLLANTSIEVNAEDVQNSLHQVGATSLKDTFSTRCKPVNARISSSSFAVHVRPSRDSRVKNSKKQPKKKDNKWLGNMRNALMIVSSLIATMAFQAGIFPPGGAWQAEQRDQVSGYLYEAGHSIMADKNPRAYTAFITFNTISYISSLSVILILISGLPMRRKSSVWLLMIIMWIAVISAMLTYSSSLYTMSKSQGVSPIMQVYIINGFYGAIAIVIAGHLIRLRLKIIEFARKIVRKDASPHSSVSSDGCQLV